ncbi:T9SS type A sorting domain-containing protein [Aureivirga marina]|uniref:T9SS type A sorting domain-containing protein n=1 Tax=Aureivirga marina TaxID=1182451 RepID=UPI0018C9DEEA|nr:T9SS type A sorting domain-containing protein [Aureivirga marina]
MKIISKIANLAKLTFILFLLNSTLIFSQTDELNLDTINLEACDGDGDGYASFDLTPISDMIQNNNPDLSLVIKFYNSQNDAESDTNSIPTTVTNQTMNIHTIWVRIEKPNGYNEFTNFNLLVSQTYIGLDTIISQCQLTITEDDYPALESDCYSFTSVSTTDSLVFTDLENYTITWTFTDSENNTVDVEQQIKIVEDTTPPTIEGYISDHELLLNENCQTFMSDYITLNLLNSFDNCSDVTITQSPASGEIITENTNVTLTFKDENNNENTYSFLINVVDQNDPIIENCLENRSVIISGNTHILEDYTTENIGITECSPYTITQTPAPHTELETGIHTISLKVEDEYGNSNTCSFQLNVSNDLSSEEFDLNSFIIYPNPTSDFISLQNIGKISSLEIFDISGKLVLEQNQNFTEKINVSSLEKEIYFINIKSKNKTLQQKLIIE